MANSADPAQLTSSDIVSKGTQFQQYQGLRMGIWWRSFSGNFLQFSIKSYNLGTH